MKELELQSFNLPTLFLPVLLIFFVVLFFWIYRKDMRLCPDAENLTGASARMPLSFLERPGRMTARDWLLSLALAVIYSILAFSFSGSTEAPQTFWRATDARPSLTLDLGEVVMLEDIMYYTGIDGRVIGNWTLKLSEDGVKWRKQPRMSQHYIETFMWKIPRLEAAPRPTRYIRITAETVWLELGELALVIRGDDGRRALFDTTSLTKRYPQYAALFDEQRMVPPLPDIDNKTLYNKSNNPMMMGRISDQNNGMISDEVYHARTAYEYTRNLPPEENTHPPLGKLLIVPGIKLFGMTPFGWRFMGILFGVLMLPVIYIFIKNLFDNTVAAVCGTAIFAFENMHFTQTHIATTDTYAVFFILTMYLFMYRYISSGYDAPFRKTLPPLFLCGLSFGMGSASKWNCLFAALGIVALYAVYLVKRGIHYAAAGRKKEYRVFLIQTLSASFAFFVVIPLVIYTLSYIPTLAAFGQTFSVGDLITGMWEDQKSMLYFHRSVMRDAVHMFQSSWYMWILDIRPIVYYYKANIDGGRAIVAAFTNPLVTIGGLSAMWFVVWDFFRRHSKTKEQMLIAAGYIATLLPWMLIARNSFVYHYFPSMIFLTLALCYVFNNILRRNPQHRKLVYAFTVVSVAIFIILFPPSSGITMADWYARWFVRWLPSWSF